MKPKIKKVKCMVYFEPEKHEGHIATPGWQVSFNGISGYGVDLNSAWEDYETAIEYVWELDEGLHK